MYLATRARVCFSFLALCLLAGGCSTGARSEKMIPATFNMQTRHKGPVVVQVSGGTESSMLMNNGEVSEAEFKKAVEESVRKSGVFSQVVPTEETAAYAIRVTGIQPISNEAAGFNMRASFVATWELVNVRTRSSVWKDILTTDHTCNMGDAMVGVERYRMARELAAQDNVKMAMEELSKLKIDGD